VDVDEAGTIFVEPECGGTIGPDESEDLLKVGHNARPFTVHREQSDGLLKANISPPAVFV
jgi:hypothetical protein